MSDSPEKYEGKEQEKSFESELTLLINKHNQEGSSNTPDYILAMYLQGCLEAFNTAVQQRETWHGRDARPSHTRYGVSMEG